MGNRRRRRSRNRDAWWKQQYGGMPVWGLVAAVVAIFGGAAFALTNLDDPSTAASNATPRPADSFSFISPEKPIVTFIGDSYTGGSDEDSGPAARWPNILGTEQGFTRNTLARGGSGYVTVGPTGDAFIDVVDEIDPDTRLVVIYGSINDVASEGEVRAAAIDLFDQVQAKVPDAEVLVVGPTWHNEAPPENIIAADAALDEAAGEAGVPFVSTLDADLLTDPSLIGEDGTHPNDEGHKKIAAFMAPIIERRLAAAS